MPVRFALRLQLHGGPHRLSRVKAEEMGVNWQAAET